MSQENVERIRAAVDAWNRGGFEGMRYFIHPDAVTTPFEEWPDDDVYYGIEGFETLTKQWTEQFEGVRWDIERIEPLEGGDALALVNQHGTIKGAGVPISAPLGVLVGDFHDDGRAAKVEFFLGWEKALEAVGLSE